MKGAHWIGFCIILLALIGSLFTVSSCNWVRLRGREETNRNLGIWRRSTRRDGGMCFFDCCSRYTDEFEADAQLKTARAGTILAPFFGVVAMIATMNGVSAFAPIRGKLMVVCAVLAAIFQGLTLIINGSELCDISQFSYCHVGMTTWAYWVSLCSMVGFVVGAVVSISEWSGGDIAEPVQTDS